MSLTFVLLSMKHILNFILSETFYLCQIGFRCGSLTEMESFFLDRPSKCVVIVDT